MSSTDKQVRPLVAVTGIGLVSSLGVGCDANWQAIIEGRSGLKTIRRFPIDELRSTVAGTVDDLVPGGSEIHCVLRSQLMAERAGAEALTSAALDATSDFPGPLFIAASPSEFEWQQLLALHEAGIKDVPAGYPRMLDAVRSGKTFGNEALMQFATISMRLSAHFGTKGMPVSVCTACASGATAIGLGLEAIRRGENAALVIGTDSTVHQEAMVRFSLLSAISTHNDPPESASRPFDKTRSGFVVAEGAAALVLENYDLAKARGAKILAIVKGYGEKADDFHRTRSKPDGSAMIAAIRNALEDASVTPKDVDHVNAHGTATPENDKMEALALMQVVGERMKQVPTSSNKSQLGHTLLAAGAVEAVISVLTLQNGIIPPTMNYREPDPAIPLDVVPNKARLAEVQTILSNSFGFGGQNACLVLAKPPLD